MLCKKQSNKCIERIVNIGIQGGMNMKFVKGMVVGGVVSVGLAMLYAETMGYNKKKMVRKGKQMAKKMGIL